MNKVSMIDGHIDPVKIDGDLISRSALYQVCYECYEKAMRAAKGEITPQELNIVLLTFEKAIKNAPAVDAVEVEALEAWLYEIAMNNTGHPLCDACEEIITRLDGLRLFARERRDEE